MAGAKAHVGRALYFGQLGEQRVGEGIGDDLRRGAGHGSGEQAQLVAEVAERHAVARADFQAGADFEQDERIAQVEITLGKAGQAVEALVGQGRRKLRRAGGLSCRKGIIGVWVRRHTGPGARA